MDSFEINKIIAAVLITVLIVFGIGKISDFMFKVERPSVAAYKVEATDVNGIVSSASTEGDLDISALLALGSIDHGQPPSRRPAERGETSLRRAAPRGAAGRAAGRAAAVRDTHR